MIDARNGDLILADNSFVIRKGLTKDEFIKSGLFGEVLSEQAYAYTRYYLKPQLIGEDRFILVLYFNPDAVVDFAQISITRDGTIPSWDNWSESEELKRKKEHDQWLAAHLGQPPYLYPWGEISSNYDPRSGSSMITIRYNAD